MNPTARSFVPKPPSGEPTPLQKAENIISTLTAERDQHLTDKMSCIEMVQRSNDIISVLESNLEKMTISNTSNFTQLVECHTENNTLQAKLEKVSALLQFESKKVADLNLLLHNSSRTIGSLKKASITINEQKIVISSFEEERRLLTAKVEEQQQAIIDALAKSDEERRAFATKITEQEETISRFRVRIEGQHCALTTFDEERRAFATKITEQEETISSFRAMIEEQHCTLTTSDEERREYTAKIEEMQTTINQLRHIPTTTHSFDTSRVIEQYGVYMEKLLSDIRLELYNLPFGHINADFRFSFLFNLSSYLAQIQSSMKDLIAPQMLAVRPYSLGEVFKQHMEQKMTGALCILPN